MTTEFEILALSTDKYRWYTEQKIDQVEALYDDGLIFIHLNGHQSNKKDWIGAMRSRSFVYDQINIKEASAKIYGNTAVLVGRAVFVINGGSRYSLAYTEVYTKKNDQWKLVNIHTCTY
jgi:uncharacterized protein with ACT and thioredoxin-like domain